MTMKFLVIAVVALVAAVQGIPYGDGYGGDGSSYEGGSEYDSSGYGNGGSGYVDQDYGGHGLQEGHDYGQTKKEHDSSVHENSDSDHAADGMSQQDQEGLWDLAFKGHAGYGQQFGNGFTHGFHE